MSPNVPTARPSVAGAVRLRAVLDHHDAARARERHDRIHVGRPAGEMDDNDRSRAVRQHRRDRFGRDIAAVRDRRRRRRASPPRSPRRTQRR